MLDERSERQDGKVAEGADDEDRPDREHGEERSVGGHRALGHGLSRLLREQAGQREGRDRQTDETVLPYFEGPELYQNPFLDRRHALDRRQFAPVLDEFYALHGWDPATGWPTPERLDRLGLSDLYEPMTGGAAQAARSPTAPPAP